MGLKERLNDDLKDAMRQRDTVRRNTIRLLLSAVRYEEIAKQRELDDDAVMQVLTKQAQQRRDSIEAYQKGSRPDLVEKEEAELDIVSQYLPEPMSADEIKQIVESAITEVSASGPQDMGRVMSKVMPQVRGRANGKEVSALVNERLRSVAG